MYARRCRIKPRNQSVRSKNCFRKPGEENHIRCPCLKCHGYCTIALLSVAVYKLERPKVSTERQETGALLTNKVRFLNVGKGRAHASSVWATHVSHVTRNPSFSNALFQGGNNDGWPGVQKPTTRCSHPIDETNQNSALFGDARRAIHLASENSDGACQHRGAHKALNSCTAEVRL